MSLITNPFQVAKSIYAGLSVIVMKVATAISSVTAATDTLTKTTHGFSVGQALEFTSGTGFTGLTALSVYYVVAVPDADTFKIAATYGGTAISVGTSSAGIFQPLLVFEAKKLDSTPSQEEAKLQRPDRNGIKRVVRRVLTAESEEFTFEIDEPKRLLEIFSGAMSGQITAPTTLYIPDPQDASGKVALKSEKDFSATITRDGNMTFGDGNFTTSTIKLSSNKQGAITWTADATV